MAKQKVALLTAGGLAPCLSSAVGGLIERYSDVAPDIELVAYRSGYQGVLLGDSINLHDLDNIAFVHPDSSVRGMQSPHARL